MSLIDYLRGWVATGSKVASFGIGRKYLNEKNYEQAERYLDPLLGLDAQEVGVSPAIFGEILCEIARCAWETNRRDRAVGIWHRAASLTTLIPHTSEALLGIATADAIAGKIEKAVETFARAIRADEVQGFGRSAVRSMLWAGQNLGSVGALSEAMKFLDRAASILEKDYPEEIESRERCQMQIGFIHKHSGDAEKALNAFKRRVTILHDVCPTECLKLSNAYYDLACQYYADGQVENCVTSLDRAEAFFERLKPAEKNLASDFASCRGIVALEKGDFAAAIAFLESSLNFHRKRGTEFLGIAMNNLAYALIKGQRLDEAEQYLNQAQPMARQDDSRRCYLNTLGALAQAKGEFESAEIHYRAALNCATSSRARATELASLGGLYAQLGRTEDARFTYERALEEFDATGAPGHPERASIQRKLLECSTPASG